MAPSRGKGKAAAGNTRNGTGRQTRRTTRSAAAVGNDVPDVYRSMLDEVKDDTFDESFRPLKRRKFASEGQKPVHQRSDLPISRSRSLAANSSALPSSVSKPAPPNLQTAEDSSEEDESDFEFEDVDLGATGESTAQPADGIEDLSISVQPEHSAKSSAGPRKKPATVAEKAHRLVIHKIHVLCLLGHFMYVNGRCNNAVVQGHLRTLLSSTTLSYLHPKIEDTQFQRNRSFLDGLQQAMDAFNADYRITSGGLMKPLWSVDGEPRRSYSQAGSMDRSDFISAARVLEGSRDTGNELFCALLRSVGVDARLVCSLQTLPFVTPPKSSTPRKPVKEKVFAIVSESSRMDQSNADSAVEESRSIGSVPSVRRRLGQPTFNMEQSQVTPPKKRANPIPKLSYPVVWVEAFNEAQQKWIPVDATVTCTVNKASKLEPPSSYDLNQMTYVIAFEDDGTARDVTKRYAKAYNAKTRRHRVEASTDGAKWLKKAMRIFHRRRESALDRDQVEDAELAQKEAREGMPANVLDFKDHPYYALERHLKRNESIHPRREVGKVRAGTAAKPSMEPVYRRQDVLVCKSADKWYRAGREVLKGEQPLKQVPARSRRQLSMDGDEEPVETTGLYAPYQTQLYVPNPVERGRIPKNAYGNLDIYVPSMIPAGGAHIKHELAQQAAKLLRIDYADAVTGFKFQGRHGTAIMEGVIVARQYQEAVYAVIEGFDHQIADDESRARSLQALQLWKRFLAALRIAERVSAYGDASTHDERETDNRFHTHASPLEDDNPLIMAGQFTVAELATSAKKSKSNKRRVESEDEFEPPEEDSQRFVQGEGGFFPDHDMPDARPSGGFLPEDDGGGFIPEGPGGWSLPEDAGEGGFVAGDGEHEDGFIHEDNGDGGFLPEHGSRYDVPDHNDAASKEHVASQSPNDDLFGEPDSNYEQEFPVSDVSRSREATAPQRDKPAETENSALAGINPVSAGDKMDARLSSTDPPATDDATLLPARSESGSQGDAESMPSHDSEDDDMEPDWLESD